MSDADYKLAFGALRRALQQFDPNTPATRLEVAAALDCVGALIRTGMLRTRAEARQSGSLRPGRQYLESNDAALVVDAARMLGLPPPLLGSEPASEGPFIRPAPE